MGLGIARRGFLKTAAVGCAACAGGSGNKWAGIAMGPAQPMPAVPGFISAGCRGTKVRVGRIYAAAPEGEGVWPTPKLDLAAEKARYDRYMSGDKQLASRSSIGRSRRPSADSTVPYLWVRDRIGGVASSGLSEPEAQARELYTRCRFPRLRFGLGQNPPILSRAPYLWTGQLLRRSHESVTGRHGESKP